MGEVPGRNTRESLLDGIREEVQAADFPAAQGGFHLGSHVLNRAEIRAVGRKVQCFIPFASRISRTAFTWRERMLSITTMSPGEGLEVSFLSNTGQNVLWLFRPGKL